MMVSDNLTFDEIDGLAQVEPGMTYPDSPAENTAKPYRVSAYVRTPDDKPIPSVDVGCFQADGKTLIESKKTDSNGRVFFDVPSENNVTLVPKIDSVSPPYTQVQPVLAYPGFWKYLFVPVWEWGRSAMFTVYPGIPAAPGGGGTLLEGDNTFRNIALVGVALVSGYLAWNWLSKGANK